MASDNESMNFLDTDRSVYEFCARGRTYAELHEQNRAARAKWERFIPETSFKFCVLGYNQSIPQRRQREVIESFSYMDFRGKIDMKNPEIIMGCFEECELSFMVKYLAVFQRWIDSDTHGTTRHKHEGDGNFREVFFGRLVRSCYT